MDEIRTPEKGEEWPEPEYKHDPPHFKEWAPYFLSYLAHSGNVTASAEYAGIGRTTVYDHRERNESFRSAWKDAIEQATDLLELEARRRAADGVLEPVFYKGRKVAAVRKYSDTLLIFLLKAHRPEKFRDGRPAGTEDDPVHIKWIEENRPDGDSD